MEDKQQNYNHWNWNAQQPQQNTATHRNLRELDRILSWRSNVRNRRDFRRRKRWNKVLERKLPRYDPKKVIYMEANMPLILWLLGVPLVIVIALMLTHVI
jgi:hypothetical protein